MLAPWPVFQSFVAGQSTLASASLSTNWTSAALGYRVKLCLPTSASPERKHILQAYGVEIVYTPGDEATDGAIRRVREIYEADPDKYFYPDQYGNPANPEAHYKTTGPEIWEQTRGADHAFCRGTWHQRHFRGNHAPAQGI